MKNNLKRVQKLIWRDILIYMIVMISSGIIFEKYEVSSKVTTPIFLLIMIILIISLFRKIKQLPYKCKNCNNMIYINFKQMFTLHAGTQRRLKCPSCGKVTWAEIEE